MAWKREIIGKVLKGKDGKADYIQIKQNVTLKEGEYLNLESKKQQLDKVNDLLQEGILSSENALKASERIEKMPDFVRFEIVRVTKDA